MPFYIRKGFSSYFTNYVIWSTVQILCYVVLIANLLCLTEKSKLINKNILIFYYMVSLLSQKVLSRSIVAVLPSKNPNQIQQTKPSKQTKRNKNLHKHDICVHKTEEPIVSILHAAHMFMTKTFILYIVSINPAGYCGFLKQWLDYPIVKITSNLKIFLNIFVQFWN